MILSLLGIGLCVLSIWIIDIDLFGLDCIVYMSLDIIQIYFGFLVYIWVCYLRFLLPFICGFCFTWSMHDSQWEPKV